MCKLNKNAFDKEFLFSYNDDVFLIRICSFSVGVYFFLFIFLRNSNFVLDFLKEVAMNDVQNKMWLVFFTQHEIWPR